MNSQHLRLKWHFEKLDNYGPRSWVQIRASVCYFVPPNRSVSNHTEAHRGFSLLFVMLCFIMVLQEKVRDNSRQN